jgi:hypothetical protein
VEVPAAASSDAVPTIIIRESLSKATIAMLRSGAISVSHENNKAVRSGFIVTFTSVVKIYQSRLDRSSGIARMPPTFQWATQGPSKNRISK